MIRDAVAVIAVAAVVFFGGYGVVQWNITKAKADACDAKVAALRSEIANRENVITELTEKGRVIIEDGKKALAISEEAIRLAKDRTRPIIVKAQVHREIAQQSHPGKTCEDALKEVFQ